MDQNMHLFLKFNNEKLNINGNETTTIDEHLKIFETKGSLVWGHGSRSKNKGLRKVNQDVFDEQVVQANPTYVFFCAKNKDERELYVGNYVKSYRMGELHSANSDSESVPSYYRTKIGTENDNNVLYVKVDNFRRIDLSSLDHIFLFNKRTMKIVENTNSNSLFYVAITEELKNRLVFSKDNLAVDESAYQREVELQVLEISPENKPIDRPKAKPVRSKSNGNSSYDRDAKTAKLAIIRADYSCEVDPLHKDFTSKVTNRNYVEAHHLIPMEFQDEYNVSIDVEANIISLCVGCHKKLHHAVFSEKKDIVKRLLKARLERLKQCHIDCTVDSVYRYYR